MNSTELGFVKYDIINNIAYLTFGHPAHNSLPGKLLSKLKDQIQELGADENVHLIVLQSEGERTFCAGASFDELASIENFLVGKQFFLGFANVINAMRNCPKIIIGRIQGKAIGGGVGLAAACDYAIATKYATIKLSELAVGIGPFVIGPAVQRKMRLAAFSQMALNATEFQTAEWAKDRGLFQEVFDTAEQMDEYIAHFSKKLLASNPDALRLLKKVFWEGTDHWDQLLDERAGMSGMLVLSDFTKNAIAAFKSK
ncbi:MAG: enoyl-CoA hydratase/isomerase family protein [Saprospiraceae bacterium]